MIWRIKPIAAQTWLAAMLLLVVSSAPASASSSKSIFKKQFVSADHFLRIYSDHPIDSLRCRKIAARVERAYAYDIEHEGWQSPRDLWRRPLILRVLADDRSENINGNVLGYAIGGRLFVVRDKYLDDPLSEGTLAHELTHVQDARKLDGGGLPSWLLEGRALTNGHNYRIKLGLAEDSFDRMVANEAVKCTAGDAAQVLGEFTGRSLKMQNIGAFFVEYLRTKWHGEGISNVHWRLSHMIEMIAAGKNFESAFKQEFSETFTSAVAAFENYLDATASKPHKRLEGTMWANTLQ